MTHHGGGGEGVGVAATLAITGLRGGARRGRTAGSGGRGGGDGNGDGESENGLKDETLVKQIHKKVGDDRQHEFFSRRSSRARWNAIPVALGWI